MIHNPDLIESTTVDDKPTVKRYIHRETGVAYISYYHHSNGIWTTPFIEGSNLDIRTRDICEDDALHFDGAIPNSANGGIVESREQQLVGENPIVEPELLFPPKEKKSIKPIGRGIRIREKDNQADPDINQMHPVDRANYEREQLQALGESLQSGIPPLAAIGQPISLTGDPLELEKTKTGDTSQVKCFTVRDDSRSFPGNIDGCYEVIKGLRGQVSQLREESIYAKEEADGLRVSLQTAILLKNQYYDDIKRLEGLSEESSSIISKLYGENRDLQSSLDKWRNHAEVQHRTMLAAAVLLIVVFVGLCLGW